MRYPWRGGKPPRHNSLLTTGFVFASGFRWIDLVHQRIRLHRRRAVLDVVEPAQHVREVFQVLALPFVGNDPRVDRHVGNSARPSAPGRPSARTAIAAPAGARAGPWARTCRFSPPGTKESPPTRTATTELRHRPARDRRWFQIKRHRQVWAATASIRSSCLRLMACQ